MNNILVESVSVSEKMIRKESQESEVQDVEIKESLEMKNYQ